MSACSRLLSRVLPVQDAMEPSDLFAGQKAREHPSRVPFHVPRRVGFEVTAGDREVDDLREKIECVIGVAGGGPAEAVEPSPDLLGGDAIERLRAEGRQQLAVEHGPDALSRGRLVSFEMASFHAPSTKSRNSGATRLGGAGRFRFGLARMAFPAHLRDGLQRHRAKRKPPRPPASVLQQDIAPPAGGPDPNPKADKMIIPNRVFPLAGAETGDGAVGEPHAFPAGHDSGLQRSADGLGGVHHRLVGKVGVLERGFPGSGDRAACRW